MHWTSGCLNKPNLTGPKVETTKDITGKVRRWSNGNQVLRCLSCGFLHGEKQFMLVKGCELLSVLISSLFGKEELPTTLNTALVE